MSKKVIKQERLIDSEEARQIADYALGHHQGAVEAAGLSVVRAIACGIQLIKAKELLPHGEFMPWYKKYLQGISQPTANRYAKLAALVKSQLTSSTTITRLDAAPEQLTPNYIRRYLPALAKVVEGKMLTELYQEYGIIKPRKAHDQEALDRQERVKARNPKDKHEEQLYFLQDWFKDTGDRLNQFVDWVEEFRVEEPALIDQAAEELRTALEKLTHRKVTLS
jgi:hypothetical protein